MLLIQQVREVSSVLICLLLLSFGGLPHQDIVPVRQWRLWNRSPAITYHDNIGLEWSGLSYQEKQAGGQTGMVMALVFLFVFLFLAAQYESWTVPIAVLLSLPVAALGAYLGVWVCGLENDVYFQIGLVMLVGLAAKNAILIVEFAKVQVDKGEDLIQSAIYAAKLRFRPILMTSLAFVLGMLPMVLASGPGSASRQAIGTGVFFGMIFAIVFGIILVPFFFVMVYKTKSKILKHKK